MLLGRSMSPQGIPMSQTLCNCCLGIGLSVSNCAEYQHGVNDFKIQQITRPDAQAVHDFLGKVDDEITASIPWVLAYCPTAHELNQGTPTAIGLYWHPTPEHGH